MAHEIIEGMDVSLTRTNDAPAWHGLDTRLECIDAAALRSTGFARPITVARAAAVDATGVTAVSDDYRAVVTTTLDQSAAKVVSIVGKRFACDPLGYDSLVKVLAPLLDKGLLSIVSAGTLNGYRRAYVTAEIQGAELKAKIMQGDEIRGYLSFVDGLDGQTKTKKFRSSVRMVCSNTVASAQRDARDISVVKHTSGFQLRLDSWSNYILEEQAALEAEAEILRTLARREINQATLDTYLRQCLDVDQKSTRRNAKLDFALQSHETDIARGTMWGAYNAAQSVLQWYTRGADAKTAVANIDNMFFGMGVADNTRFMQLALATA